MNIPASTDVVVIGGGPAGSSAANHLAQHGCEVVLLERAQHPRLVVGESLLPHFWRYADALGATDDIIAADFQPKSGAVAMWKGVLRHYKLADFGHDRPALHVERTLFDSTLLNVAMRQGASVFQNVAVRKVLFDEERACGVRYALPDGSEGEIRSKFVVDASGQAGVLASQLGFREFDRDLRFNAVWGYFEDSDYVAAEGVRCPFSMRRELLPTTMQIETGDWGWCWHILMNNSTSVGLVISPSQRRWFKSGADDIQDRFLAALREVPIIKDLLARAKLIPGSVRAIRDFAYYPRRLAGNGWFLAGDAAAFVDPINSAGMVMALYSGFLSAWAIQQSLDNDAKREDYVNLFSHLLRSRLSLFRIAALPPGTNSYAETYPNALEAARFDSHLEGQLLYAQALCVGRVSNVEAIEELDPSRSFQRAGADHVVELDGIRALEDAPQPV